MGWEKISHLLDKLTEGSPLIIHPLQTADKFVRGRILKNPDQFNNIDELSHPPTEKCLSFGRCNRPLNPLLYAGIGYELSFSEIGAKSGDYVGLLHMSPKEELMCLRVGALDLWRRTTGHCVMHDDMKEKIKSIHANPENIQYFLLDAFISDFFSRKGDASTYALTSAYTAATIESNSKIAGLIYDSVDHTAGHCLALKPNIFSDFVRPTEVQIVKITSHLGYGIFDFEEIAFSNDISNGKIKWTDSSPRTVR